jgi:two-component system response regulator VanR
MRPIIAIRIEARADPFTKTVQVAISRLRRKLADPTIIQTLPGVGYGIEDSARRR